MPDDVSPAQAVLDGLGLVLFAREDSGALRLLGEAPAWLLQLWPKLKEDRTLNLAEASPFLENFLIDAEECWKNGGDARAESGPWIEESDKGETIELQASALTASGRSVLLLEKLGEAFAAKKAVLQRARETVIAHQRLNSEIQKKEILLHCVADEMSAALANVITSLRLIELEENGENTRRLLGLANRATEAQQGLIHRILGVFAEELGGVSGPVAGGEATASWDDAFRHALEFARPLFEEKKVQLDASGATTTNARLPFAPSQLERIIGNLLQNALERSAPGSAVVVRANDEIDSLFIAFADQGPRLAADTCENLFARFNPATFTAPASALRLHFCRIAIENSGGEIGFQPLPEGGHRFWIRLTKSRAPA